MLDIAWCALVVAHTRMDHGKVVIHSAEIGAEVGCGCLPKYWTIVAHVASFAFQNINHWKWILGRSDIESMVDKTLCAQLKQLRFHTVWNNLVILVEYHHVVFLHENSQLV